MGFWEPDKQTHGYGIQQMTCKLDRPTPQELWDRTSKDFSNFVLGGADIIPESNEHYLVALNYAVKEEFFSLAESMWRERDPRYACCDNLIKIAAQDGVYRKAATSSQGYIKITGISGARIPQDMKYDIGGNIFIAAGSVAPSIPATGEAIIRVMAEKPGATSNEILTVNRGTIINPPAGINVQFDIYGRLCGGSKEETCEQLRSRYLERLQYSPTADLKWIMAKAAEWPCVTDVCEVGDACCELDDQNQKKYSNELYLYVLFRNTFPCGIAPNCVIDDMNEWLFGLPQGQGRGQVPFGIFGAIRYIKPTYINIMIDGMACATSSQQSEVENRIKDYISLLCPSRGLPQRNIERIIAQIVGDSVEFQVYIEPYVPADTPDAGNGLAIDDCGNVQVNCDYKICLHEVQFVNMTATTGNC